MSPLPLIRTNEIKDFYSRENFDELKRFLRAQSPLLDFKHFEITFTSTQANYKFKHNLGFIPQDIIQTSLIGSGTVVWNYSLFDATNLNITVTGTVSSSNPTVIRFFVGSYNSGVT